MHTPIAFPSPVTPFHALRKRRAAAGRQSLRRFRQALWLTDADLDTVFSRNVGGRSWCTTSFEQISADWRKLFRLNHQLATYGPSDLVMRNEIKLGANEILNSISSDTSLCKDRLFQFADATELLVDLGSDDEVSLQEIAAWLGSLVHFYDRQGESIYLCRVLLKLANTYRHLGDTVIARQLIRYAFNILHGKRKLTKPMGQLIFMEAVIWDLRMRPWDSEANERVAMLEGLMDEIGTPTVRLNGTRELTAHWKRRDEIAEASKWSDELLKLELTTEDCAHIVRPTVIRPRIELLLENRNQDKRKKEQAIELIRGDYLTQYERDRRRLPYREVMRWSERFDLGLTPSLPIYESPIIFHLPRGCEAA
jgi:hypothetical protein